jgi:RNA polymerase sigma-70 factor, ECF subfamily
MAMESTSCYHDNSLVRDAQGGNHAAFAQLVHTHDEAVLKLALRITGSESDAQDIYQEAFLKIYKKLDCFRFECSISTWIYRIVTNVCLDHLRKNRNRKESSAIQVNGEGEECDLLTQISDDRPANNPERRLLVCELSARISCALQKLTPRERVVFELKHFQGMKLRAVGEILNTSEESVKSSLVRATQKLRLELDGYTKPQKSSRNRGCNDPSTNQTAIPKEERAHGNNRLATTVNHPRIAPSRS